MRMVGPSLELIIQLDEDMVSTSLMKSFIRNNSALWLSVISDT